MVNAVGRFFRSVGERLFPNTDFDNRRAIADSPVLNTVTGIGAFANGADALLDGDNAKAAASYGEAAASKAVKAGKFISGFGKKGKCSVYRCVEGGKTTYVGITNNFWRRHGEHLRKTRGFGIEKLR